jgi:hypothetical protein
MTSTHHHQLPVFFCTSNFQTACISSRTKNYNEHINLLFEVFVLFKFSDVSLSLFQSEEIFYSISSTPWYLWNTKNRKIVQLFLFTAQTPLVLSCSDIIVVNNELLIKVGIHIVVEIFILFYLMKYF